MSFAVFAGEQYYPGGGWDDWEGSFETRSEADQYAAGLKYRDWWQIVDLKMGVKVAEWWEGKAKGPT